MGFFIKLYIQTKKYLIVAEIRPVNAIENSKYTAFTSYLTTLETLFIRQSFSENLFALDKDVSLENKADTINSDKGFKTEPEINFTKNFPTYDINKVFLYRLFLDKISQNQILEKFKNSKIIDGNQKNKTEELQTILSELKSKISTHNTASENKNNFDTIKVNFKSNRDSEIIDFLNFINQEINIEVYNHTREMFDNYVGYLNTLIFIKPKI